MCLIKLLLMIVGLLTLWSVCAYAFTGYTWWTPTASDDMSSARGAGRSMLILLMHVLGLWCAVLAVVLPLSPTSINKKPADVGQQA